jgi:hypothetical protein
MIGGVGKYIAMGSGCGMCGCCGGILEENVQMRQARGELEKELMQAQAVNAADYCPPFSPLLKGKHKLDIDALKDYVGEMKKLPQSAVLRKWREAMLAKQMAGEMFPAALLRALEAKGP